MVKALDLRDRRKAMLQDIVPQQARAVISEGVGRLPENADITLALGGAKKVKVTKEDNDSRRKRRFRRNTGDRGLGDKERTWLTKHQNMTKKASGTPLAKIVWRSCSDPGRCSDRDWSRKEVSAHRIEDVQLPDPAHAGRIVAGGGVALVENARRTGQADRETEGDGQDRSNDSP